MNPILVALDVAETDRAVELARSVLPHVGGFKVGLELLMSEGPGSVSAIADLGLPVFADAKLHDIPNTVGAAATALALHGARWVSAHSAGGREMVEAAVEGAAEGCQADSCGILAITVLTSFDRHDLEAVGMSGDLEESIDRLARLSGSAGAEGVVCSPHEVELIKTSSPLLTTVTPGIRPAGVSSHDQKRTATPSEAIHAGADLVVIGRAITTREDPAAAAAAIVAELTDAGLA